MGDMGDMGDDLYANNDEVFAGAAPQYEEGNPSALNTAAEYAQVRGDDDDGGTYTSFAENDAPMVPVQLSSNPMYQPSAAVGEKEEQNYC